MMPRRDKNARASLRIEVTRNGSKRNTYVYEDPRETTTRIISSISAVVAEDAQFCAFGPSWVFGRDYLLSNILTKYVDENTDPADQRRTRAIVKWLGVEDRNIRTSERIWMTETLFKGVGYSTKILEVAGDFITRIIGDDPGDELLLSGSFSGGASTSLPRRVGTMFRKFTGTRDVTSPCFALFRELDFAGWASLAPEVLKPRIVKGNVLFTVPKTSVIDRVAAKEPDLNIFCQKAVGDFIRRRLKSRARIDLNDQRVNQRLAKVGAETGRLATIDLSSASDSLSVGLVTRLLPDKWVKLLDALRCHRTLIDGTWHTNAMWSSMGNGFTFELESLIFYALAKAVCYLSGVKGRVSVYGDDIILPGDAAPMFIPVINWCGFKVNVDKTFISGPFRESCGKHYHGGLDVSPFFIREPVKTVSDAILVLNQFRAWILRMHGDLGLPGEPRRLTAAWRDLANYLVPQSLWGGYDLESRTQLVSGGAQRSELLEEVRRAKKAEARLQLGMYLGHLSKLDRRTNGPSIDETETTLTIPTGKLKMRRVSHQPAVFGARKPLFFGESW